MSTMRPELLSAVRLVREGKGYTEAARIVGVTRNAVAGACHRAGVKTGKRPLTDVHKRAVSAGMVAWRRRNPDSVGNPTGINGSTKSRSKSMTEPSPAQPPASA